MGVDAPRFGGGLQSVTEGGGDALTLVVLMDIEPVQIGAGTAVRTGSQVSKARDLFSQHGHQRVMGAEGGIPYVLQRVAAPGRQLGRGVVNGADMAHRVLKKRDQGGAVLCPVGTKDQRLRPGRHCESPWRKPFYG